MPHTPPMPHLPLIVGFEVPGPAAAAHDDVLVALLDAAPGADWLTQLSKHAADFKLRHGLKDVRCVGRHLCLVGPNQIVRSVVSAVRGFVDHLTIQVLAARIRRERDTPAQAGQAREWIDAQVAEQVEGVPQMLRAIHDLTGMRFTALSQVDQTHWNALAFYDQLDFGMAPGQKLELEVTICGDALKSREVIVFGAAADHPVYACSPLPALYGFKSYISVPILLEDDTVFGTVCALDAEARTVTPDMIQLIRAYARRIASQVEPAADRPVQAG